MNLKTLPAFETSDGKRFFDEETAREHERGGLYRALVHASVQEDTRFARLDLDLLAEWLHHHAETAGQIAAMPLSAERMSFSPTKIERLTTDQTAELIGMVRPQGTA